MDIQRTPNFTLFIFWSSCGYTVVLTVSHHGRRLASQAHPARFDQPPGGSLPLVGYQSAEYQTILSQVLEIRNIADTLRASSAVDLFDRRRQPFCAILVSLKRAFPVESSPSRHPLKSLNVEERLKMMRS